jgi:hypothetical protein
MAPSKEELEQLSSQELHDRAIDVAKRRLDVRFFWRLLQALPAAEAATGHLDEAEADVQSLIARLDDLRDSGQGDIADALRPLFIEYLAEHG